MIVEDDGPIRESFRMILELEGYGVIEAENGAQALSLLESGNLPALLFLDLMMPVMDGVEFYHLLKSKPEWNAIVAVIISASGNLNEKLAVLGEPTPPSLKKPVELEAIIEITQKHCPLIA
jgi:CheY-like chemotaxis protein